jgi:hypothetical protein
MLWLDWLHVDDDPKPLSGHNAAGKCRTHCNSGVLQDYLVAEGYNSATAKAKVVSFEAKYYFSQDGAK